MANPEDSEGIIDIRDCEDGWTIYARVQTRAKPLVIRKIPEHKVEGVKRAIHLINSEGAEAGILNNLRQFGIEWD